MTTIRDRVRELRRVRAGDLRPSPRNWRTHPKAQQDVLRGVLAEIGYADALLCRECEDGTLEIVDGHLRAETTPEDVVPVLVLDVDAIEAEKLLVTLDPLAAMASADAMRLGEILAELRFDSDDVSTMVGDLARQHGLMLGGDVIEPPIPLPPDDPITRPGDLWLLGRHRLLCGDSGDVAPLDRLLDGAVIDLVHMDPPYNVKVEPRSNNAIAAGNSSFSKQQTHHQSMDLARHPEKAQPTTTKMRAKDRPLANDFVTDDAFDALLLAWFANAARVLKPGGSFYVWGGYANLGNYPGPLEACGLYFSQAIVWDKLHPVLTRKDFMGAFEICFYGWKQGAGHHFYGPNNAVDLWHVKKVNPQSMVHLTEKPVELAARAIQYSSQPGEHVLDLFGGSGSTLMACEQQDRRAFLMELDTQYCDVIVQRWEQFTGRKAERVPVGGDA
ncbi:MAG: DNA modification methylase [Phycisphaeraceae bacterium]|nr:DNA modification methylase [Phycisphaeraceae bacterium]